MSEEGTSNGNLNENSEMPVYKKEALNVINFKLVYEEDDLESNDAITFKPEMAHQIFGESESIFGYRSLSISLNYLHNSCKCYLDVKSAGKIVSSHIKADNIVKLLDPWLPGNFTCSYDDFLGMLNDENHEQIYGDIIKTFQANNEITRFSKDPIKATYKITQNNIDSEDFKDFHSRFETFIVWFIDAANFIDLDDERWIIFYIYEEFEHPITGKIYRTPVGFCSVYKFYAFPNNIRPRISQFFILPSHQKKGLGTALYETVASCLRSMNDVIDVTVEGPTTEFQKIRDLDDCFTMHKELLENKTDFFETDSRQLFEIAKKCKIGKRQVQRVYDILGIYYSTEKGPLSYAKYVDDIKDRFKRNNERQSRASKRFCNLDRAGPTIQTEKNILIDTEYKKYLEDLEPSVKYLQKKMGNRLKEWIVKKVII